LAACVHSIQAAGDAALVERVVIVDNASTDGSAEGLPVGLPVHVIRNDENVGFAAGCNQGATAGSAPYILFLNFDIVLRAGSLREPLAFMERPENESVGICGIALQDERGRVSPSVARFPSARAMLGHMLRLDRLGLRSFPRHFVPPEELSATQEVDQVMGAFFLVRRSVFEALSGFDERFFVFYEELDFSLRARQAGWRSVFLPAAAAMHESEVFRATPTRIYLSRRGRVLYAHKHFSRAGAVAVAAGTLMLEPLARLALAAATRSADQARTAVLSTAKLWRELPLMLTGSAAPPRPR
jgi:GT2 family glycosyltransferase